MTEAFDPYYKWLGIPPDEQPPDHYRLLGLKRYESDGDVISNAADQRMILLRTFQTGKHGADSQRLLNEIAKARLALLAKESKTQYDTELRLEEAAKRRERDAARAALKASRSGPLATKTAAKPTLKPQAAAPAPRIELESKDESVSTFVEVDSSVLPVFKAADASAPAARPLGRRKAAHEYKKRLVGIVVGGILGLVIGYSLLCNIRPGADFLGIFRNSAPQEDTTPEPVAAAPDAGKRPEGTPKPRPTPNGSKTQVQPKSKRPDNPKVEVTPLPKPEEATGDDSSDPFLEFATAGELKPVADTSAATVATFEVAQRAKLDELTLSDAAATLAQGQKIRLDAVSGQEARWRAVLSGESEIALAEFFVDGRTLRGQWTPQAAQSPAAEQLRNCALTVRIGEEKRSLALRKPLKIEPLVLDMGKQINIQKIATDQAALAMLPPVEKLFIEIHKIDFPVPADMKNERRQAPFKASAREALSIVFELATTEEKPVIRIKAGQIKDAWELRAESAVEGKEFVRDSVRDKPFDMTFSALKKRKRDTEVRLIRVEKEFKELAKEKSTLEEGIKKLQFRRTPQDLALLRQARGRLADVDRDFTSKNAEHQHIKTSLTSIDIEEALSTKLHKTAKIYFRVFMRAGDAEIDLVRADD